MRSDIIIRIDNELESNPGIQPYISVWVLCYVFGCAFLQLIYQICLFSLFLASFLVVVGLGYSEKKYLLTVVRVSQQR